VSLYRRPNSPHYWVRFQLNGREVRLSSGTENRRAAEEFETKARSRAWRQVKLEERPPYPWSTARQRWLTETRKRSKKRDEQILAWFDEHLKDADVQGITREVIEELRALKAEERSQATADRYMALLRAILRKCVNDWQVLGAAPKVPMYRPRSAEPRWLTREQFAMLCKELPEHLQLAARFAVLTGLRMGSMLSLKWERVDLKQRRAWIPSKNMKAERTHGLPLSQAAVAVLKELRVFQEKQEAEHRIWCVRHSETYKPTRPDHVFTWRRENIADCNTKSFQDAVERAKLCPLRWHDLRHTFASWAIQNGVAPHELMQLGGWASYSMVLRYAHLAPDHLALAAEKVAKASHKNRHTKNRGGSSRLSY
jgi:integrase